MIIARLHDLDSSVDAHERRAEGRRGRKRRTRHDCLGRDDGVVNTLPPKGLTSRRGYGWAHQKLRERVKRTVLAGEARCWRCGKLIAPQENCDLGHDDHN